MAKWIASAWFAWTLIFGCWLLTTAAAPWEIALTWGWSVAASFVSAVYLWNRARRMHD